MSRALAIAAFAAIALAGCGGGEGGTFDKSGFLAELSTWDAVKSSAASEDGQTIYVGVLDNGSRRDGYAQSICYLARDYAQGDLRSRVINILDVAKAATTGERVELGKDFCKV